MGLSVARIVSDLKMDLLLSSVFLVFLSPLRIICLRQIRIVDENPKQIFDAGSVYPVDNHMFKVKIKTLEQGVTYVQS